MPANHTSPVSQSHCLSSLSPDCVACRLQALRALGVSIVTGVKVTAMEDTAAQAAAAAAAEQQAGLDNSSSSSTYAPPSPSSTLAATTGSSPAEPSYIVRLEPTIAYSSSSSSSSELPADLVLWTAGSRPASQPLRPFPVDARGQLETDPTLRVVRHSRVFALGDVAKGQPGNDGSSTGVFYPATAQVAFQQADYAAWNIWSAINGRPLLPFRWVHGSLSS